jgi:hypothetical protein
MSSMTYEQFGSAFVREAVTPDRIRGVIRGIAGDVVKVGPMAAGPGGIASAKASGTVGDPSVEKTGDDPLAYTVTLPVDLKVDVVVAGTVHHYKARASVRVGINVHLEEPLSICIEPTPPGRRDVTVSVQAQGLPAKVLGRVGDIDNEMRREIATYVKARIESDGSQFSNVDLRPLMLAAWPTD